MTENELRERALFNMRKGVSDVVIGREKFFSSNLCSPADVVDHLNNKWGVEIQSVIDSLWWSLEINNEPYIVEGSAYYGGVRFFKAL